MCVIQFEFTRYEVSHVDEVVDVGETPGSPFVQLYFGVDTFEQIIVEFVNLEMCEHAAPMTFNGFGEIQERLPLGIAGLSHTLILHLLPPNC